MIQKSIEKLDITKFFDEKVCILIDEGFEISHKLGLKNFDTDVLLYQLLNDLKVQSILGREKVQEIELAQKVYDQILAKVPSPQHTGIVSITVGVQQIFLVAFQEVRRQRKRKLGTEDVLLAFAQNPRYAELFQSFDLDIVRVEQRVEREGGMFSARGTKETPLLDRYSTDVTDVARRGGYEPVVARESEQLQITRVLARQEKNNVMIVGERGVGKKTVIKGLAGNIFEGSVPAALRGIRILELDLHALQSVLTSRERVEAMIYGIRQELVENTNVLILIEDFGSLFKFEESRELFELGTLLKPMILKGEIRVVATIDSETYRKVIEPDATLAKSFALVRIEEPNEETAVEMVKSAALRLSKYHSVEISGDAVRSAVYLSKRYLPEKQLPEKAVDLLDEACSKASLENKQAVSEEDINLIISEKTGIPLQKITESEQAKLVNLEHILSEQVVGQDRAVVMVSEAIRRARAGLKDPKKPIGSFIFMGPTGVGKTELAKALTKIVYGNEKAMIRLDMSEFSEPHTVQRLVGAPPGYVGYEEGGQLTNPVFERPYSLILLDEIEKAHPKVFDIFLQVLDDGRLTDGKGRTVDFRNTIVIFTSNIASNEILNLMKGKPTNVDAREILMPVLSQYFRPEFVNRFDAVIIFNPLTIDVMRLIARINVDKFADKLKQQGIKLIYSDHAIEMISTDSYEPKFGARPLLRYLQQKVENVVAKRIIAGDLGVGGVIDLDEILLANNAETATSGVSAGEPDSVEY